MASLHEDLVRETITMPTKVSGAKRNAARRSPSGSAARSTRRDAGRTKDPVAAQRNAEALQVEQFSSALELFQNGKYGLAARVLRKVEAGPDPALGHRARVYLEICGKKRVSKRPKLESADDYYNYAVELVNDRRLDDAFRAIKKGLTKAPDLADLHYLKAVVKVLLNEPRSAYQPLKKAIALAPEIRIQAQRDPDLRSVMHRKQFYSLVFDDK